MDTGKIWAAGACQRPDIPIGKSFNILYYWVNMTKFSKYDDWWITSVPAMMLQKWRIS